MICISHAEADAAAAEAFANVLIDCTDLTAGDICRTGDLAGLEFGDLMSSLRDMIETSDAVVCVVSPDAASSRVAAFEIGAAWAMDKLIFLVFMPGIDFRDMPELVTNYPYAGTGGHDASISVVALVREIADFVGAKIKRSSNMIDAIDRFLKTARASELPVDAGESAEDEDYGFGSATPIDSGESFSIVCVYDVVALGTPSAGRTTVTAPWLEIFKSFAPSLDRPQDEEYIMRLLIEFCKTRDAKFAQNCQYGMFKKAAVESYCFMRLMAHFEDAGAIVRARAPHSAFQQKADKRKYWQITDRGSDYLRAAYSTHIALQEWHGGGSHVARGAVLKVDKDR